MKTYTFSSYGQNYLRANADGTTSTIPVDPNNTDYQRMLEEVEAGEAEVVEG
jgi:hypothetical protein